MKTRSPLRRKTGLSRRTPLVRKNWMRRVSAKQRARLLKYSALIAKAIARGEFSSCFVVGCGNPVHSGPHHPKLRGGENLFYFKPVCLTHHNWIHANANKARELGLLEA